MATPGSQVATPRFAFGVGCFYFSPRGPIPAQGQTSWYRGVVKETLERIPNIENVVVEHGEDPDPQLLPLGARPWPSLNRFRSFRARPSFVVIEFDVYIPTREQRQMLRHLSAESLEVENFHVLIEHAQDMPVAFVVTEMLEGQDRNDGSTAVMLVRDYLGGELLDDPQVEFSVLGPSPFHGDFFIEADPNLPQNFAVTRQCQVGYDSYVCKYRPEAFDGTDLREVMSELSSELSLFYDIVRRGRVQRADWNRIDARVRQSLLPGRPRDIRSRSAQVYARLRRGHHLRRLTADLVVFEMNRLRDRQGMERAFQARYVTSEEGHLRETLEKERANLDEYPTEQIARLLQFFEHRHSETLKLTMALLAAIVGGIVGAWITALL